MTDLTVNKEGAQEVKKHLDALKDKVTESEKALKELVNARDEKLSQLTAEQKQFGAQFADSQAKVKELSDHFAGVLEFRTKASDAIDKLELQLKKLNMGNILRDKDGLTLDEKQARHLGKLKHFQNVQTETDKPAPHFNHENMAADVIENAKLYEKAFNDYMRLPHYVNNMEGQMNLSAEDRKALATFQFTSKTISTASHGNQLWLPLTMTNKIERCFEEQTDLASLVNTATISNAGMQFLRENEDVQDAQWECEFSCNEKGLDVVQPNLTTIMAHALRASVCATNQMLDDASFDLEGYIAQKAAEAFVHARARGILKGTGNGMPQGGMRDGNHVVMDSGSIPSTPSGDFSWQDLVSMKWKHAIRFHANRSWWMDKDAAAATFTMTDGEGRPIWSESTLAANIQASGINGFSQQSASYGIPSLLGLPARIITQMDKYLDATGTKVIGSKPIGLGNWKAWYTLVERKGFSVLRDPFSRASCNSVVWHFYARNGGDVICPQAAIFLRIK